MTAETLPSADTVKLAHAHTVTAVLESLQSADDGLSTDDATRRLHELGPNALPAAPPTPAWRRFLHQFQSALIYVLIVSAVIAGVLGHALDAAVIIAVIVGNAVIGFIQEGKAQRALEAISAMLAPQAVALRDGQRHRVPASELVPGDVVILDAGDRVPADVRWLAVRGLHVDEAALTGESVPVAKQVAPVAAEAVLGDRRSVAFSGTLVTSGQGTGVVFATGAATELGKVTGLLRSTRKLTSPLIERMDQFAHALTATILAVCAGVFLFGWLVHGIGWGDLFIAIVGIAVAAIPEGLPAVITITLALGARTMAARRAIVRKLPAIETLGSVSVICTDKTGTLTANRMRVAGTVVATGETASADESGVMSTPEEMLTLAAVLANEAMPADRERGRQAVGDPLETALLDHAEAGGHPVQRIRAASPRLDLLPFDSVSRLMATMNEAPDDKRVMWCKGAPDTLLPLCNRQYGAHGPEPLTPDFWTETLHELAEQGQRVIACACSDPLAEGGPLDPGLYHGNLVFLGLIGLDDPPRPEAVEAVAACQAAGNRVKMITGDHAATARAIARRVGLAHPENVLTGTDLDALSDEELRDNVQEVDVFARTTPADKLRLVKALQANGATVAMTGDGVNDAPALKRADIGVAMGERGTEGAKEASDLVLADDNFATIAAAVAEGRRVFDNLIKTIAFMLPTNAGEAAVLIAAILANLTLPMTPGQVLWVNLVTAVTLALALAFDPAEPDVMNRPPRPPRAPLFDRRLAIRTVVVGFVIFCGVFSVFAWAMDQGKEVEVARTIATNTLVGFEIVYLFAVRRGLATGVAPPRAVWTATITVILCQLALTYAPPLQLVFRTAALNVSELAVVVGMSLVFAVIMELYRRLEHRFVSPPSGPHQRPGASSGPQMSGARP